MREYIFSGISLAITLSIYFFLSGISYSFPDWEQASCMPDHCFCENPNQTPIRQPSNTWSSLSFCFVGFYILLSRFTSGKRKENRSSFGKSAIFSILYGLSLILIGFGSVFFHASLSLAGQFFDVTGMNCLALFIFLFHIHRVRKFPISIFLISYLILNLILAYSLFAYPFLRRYLFGIILISSLIPGFAFGSSHSEWNYRWIASALIIQAIAFFIWILDLQKIICTPDSYLQGHAVWHILGAIASYCLYRFYLSERVKA